jgi:hypothetical protein
MILIYNTIEFLIAICTFFEFCLFYGLKMGFLTFRGGFFVICVFFFIFEVICVPHCVDEVFFEILCDKGFVGRYKAIHIIRIIFHIILK